MITRDDLEEQLRSNAQQRVRHQRALAALDGADQLARHQLALIEKREKEAEAPPQPAD